MAGQNELTESSEVDDSNSIRSDRSTNTNDSSETSFSAIPNLIPKKDLFCYANDDDSSSCSSSDTDSIDDPDYSSLDDFLNGIDGYSVAQFVRGHTKTKKRKIDLDVEKDLRPIAFVRFNARRGKMKPITLKALLDSGAEESLVDAKFTKKLKIKAVKGNNTKW